MSPKLKETIKEIDQISYDIPNSWKKAIGILLVDTIAMQHRRH